ncbi:MAG: Lipoprotein [Klenkia sp.]|nr:Lipoprotein [Klenkia sp.]
MLSKHVVTRSTRSSHPTRAAGILGALVAASVALSACSSSENTAASETPTTVPADATFNAADITFAQSMIAHHEQAVSMADLVADRSTDPDVLDLADRIQAAQEPEIDTLDGWLDSWGADSETSGMDHSRMGGMMTEEDMSSLEAASGVQFDRLWLQMMLEHHTGAVGMAQTEIDDGEDPQAIALAQDVQSSQGTEITEMEQLLQSLATQ